MDLRRLVWVGPLTVVASIAAVLLVRGAVVTVLHPEPAFLPLTVTPTTAGHWHRSFDPAMYRC